MDTNFVITIGQQVFWMVVKLTAPLLGFGMAVGLLVSIFQAATQIQEQTLAFVPKIAAVMVSLLIFGPWMLRTILEFTQGILGNLMSYVR